MTTPTITFGRFEADKMNEFTDAGIFVNGDQVGRVTRVTGDPAFGCLVVTYIVDIGEEASMEFRVTKHTNPQKALHNAKTWARNRLEQV